MRLDVRGAVPVTPEVTLGRMHLSWDRSYIFAVINTTPDSFYDGGSYAQPGKAIAHGVKLVQAGADILDIGGESTRPGAEPVDVAEELSRVLPVIKGLTESVEVPISIDTTKAAVAIEAVSAGAAIVNDVSGGLMDEQMLPRVAQTPAHIVLGHLRGRPQDMQQKIDFTDVVSDVIDELKDRVRAAVRAGFGPERIWIDPGLGFGKTAQQTMALLGSLERIRNEVGYPLLIGPSRKSFIGAVTGEAPVDRLMGTCAAVAISIFCGANAVRLHDVSELHSAVRVSNAIRRQAQGEGI